MKNITIKNPSLIEDSYQSHRQSLYFYIHQYIADTETCRDMVQDIFLRLMEYPQFLCRETMESFLYTIAHNLIRDFLRRFYLQQEIISNLSEVLPVGYYDTEEEIIARDIRSLEANALSRLPGKRRRIYTMARFQEMRAPEIARQLHIAQKTVENQLYNSRKEVREYIRQCI